MYTEIPVDMSNFNHLSKVLRVKMPKNHKIFSQFWALLISVQPSPAASRWCDKFTASVGLLASPSCVHYWCRSFWRGWTMAVRSWPAFRVIYWPSCSQFWMLPYVLCFLLENATMWRRSFRSSIGYELLNVSCSGWRCWSIAVSTV